MSDLFKRVQSKRQVTQPLPDQFSKYKANFKQLFRTEQTAIYQRTSEGCGSVQYEVIRIYVDQDGKEHYPGSSTWGARGWTTRTMERAIDRAKALILDLEGWQPQTDAFPKQ